MTVLYIVLGTIFGFILSRSGAADYDYVQGMFLFERFQLYGIIGDRPCLRRRRVVADQAPRPDTGRHADPHRVEGAQSRRQSSEACCSASAGR